jgi:hypothetical protein
MNVPINSFGPLLLKLEPFVIVRYDPISILLLVHTLPLLCHHSSNLPTPNPLGLRNTLPLIEILQLPLIEQDIVLGRPSLATFELVDVAYALFCFLGSLQDVFHFTFVVLDCADHFSF